MVGGRFAIAQHSGLAAENGDQFVIDDLDHLLGRVEGAGKLGGASLLLDRGNEVLDHREVDVCLEQRNPDLACCRVDIGLGQSALAAEVLERRREAVLQGVEHERPYVGVLD